MADTDPPAGRDPGDSDLSATYVRVLILEVLVVAALFWFSRYFS